MLAALNDIDRQLMGSETVADRLHHLFGDFIERVLLRDYAVITTTAHPAVTGFSSVLVTPEVTVFPRKRRLVVDVPGTSRW